MSGHVLALCGGVGGAKLAFGLTQVLPAEDLTIVVNTGDDFTHLGLRVSPDIDTVVYTLAGLSDRERGWGLAGETWRFMDQLKRLGGEGWFNLGDQDLAMHVERTRRLAAGETLSEVTAALSRTLGLTHSIVPMSDDPVRTIVETEEGDLAFQHYFVREQCRPRATGVRYEGSEAAQPSPGLAAAMTRPDLAAVIICPSNPYLSIGPVLSLRGVGPALQREGGAPIVAVSPIVGGKALKGPAGKLMQEFGVAPSLAGVAHYYDGLLDGLVADEADRAEAETLSARRLPTLVTGAVMASDADRVRLARATLDFALGLRASSQGLAS
jgi:LPPG:FO 2-phospho-L-lactate transferase